MANEITHNFPLKPDAYAAFDAISLRNLIIQRLNEQGLVTDQNYIGSNLASIIDIISFSFNTLIYYLNRTSNESMFTEAQLYENINRIVKLLDYKPIGYQTSTLAFNCSTSSFLKGDYTIPRYSYIMAGGTPFSFNEDITFTVLQDNVALELTDLSNKKLLYQGVFKEYPIHIAAGDLNETIIVNVTNTTVDHFNVFVYVYEQKQKKWVEYKEVSNNYTQNSFARTFEKKLNSNLLYEITLGDGINGRRLEEGDKVAIYYLQSAGADGVIGPNVLEGTTAAKVIYSTPTYDQILASINNESYTYINNFQFSRLAFANPVGSTLPKNIETADSIRANAPLNFKSQMRLVTQDDFENYIKTNFANFISDVRVFSNWDYTGKYLKYFHDINLNPGGFRQVILNQVLYADSCNFNNIYVCGLPRVSKGSTLKYLLPAQKEIIASNINLLKTITTEVSFLDPIYKAINFGILINNETIINEVNAYKIVLSRYSNSKRSLRSIKQEVVNTFKTFFDQTNIKLGAMFDYSKLYGLLMSIEGVSKIVTQNMDTNQTFEGLSFFLWNPIYPDLDKLTLVNNYALQDFELMYFENLSTIETRIDVI